MNTEKRLISQDFPLESHRIDQESRKQERLLPRPPVDFDLGALGAWCCLGLVTSLIVLTIGRQLWLWLF